MADFSTEVEMNILLPDREVRSARRKLEGGLSDIEIGVSAGSGAATRAVRSDGGAASSMSRFGRKEHRWARQRTSLMETSVELLTSIEDKVGDGGGSGVGGFLGGLGARSILGGAAVTGGLALAASKVITVTGVASVAASSVLAVQGTIDMNAEDILTTSGTLGLGAATVLAVTGTLGLSAPAVLAVTGTLGLAASAVLAVNGTTELTAANILSVTGALTLTAASALAVTGTLSLAASAVIAVVGAATFSASELIEISKGGEGIGPAHDAGQTFADMYPGAADFIETGFKKNPIADMGAVLGGNWDHDVASEQQRQQRVSSAVEGTALNRATGTVSQGETTVEVDNSTENNITVDPAEIVDEIRKERDSDLKTLQREIERKFRNATNNRRPGR